MYYTVKRFNSELFNTLVLRWSVLNTFLLKYIDDVRFMKISERIFLFSFQYTKFVQSECSGLAARR